MAYQSYNWATGQYEDAVNTGKNSASGAYASTPSTWGNLMGIGATFGNLPWSSISQQSDAKLRSMGYDPSSVPTTSPWEQNLPYTNAYSANYPYFNTAADSPVPSTRGGDTATTRSNVPAGTPTGSVVGNVYNSPSPSLTQQNYPAVGSTSGPINTAGAPAPVFDPGGSNPPSTPSGGGTTPGTAPSKYLSVPNGANDQYGFLTDAATVDLAKLLGGTPVLQSGLQSGTGPYPQPNYNQIRMPDGTLIGAGAAQHYIDQYGLDAYMAANNAIMAGNARTGYTDPALNTPESQRYTAVQQMLGNKLANPTNVAPLSQDVINSTYQKSLQQPGAAGLPGATSAGLAPATTQQPQNTSDATLSYILSMLAAQQQAQSLYGLGSLGSLFSMYGAGAVPSGNTNSLLALLSLLGGDGFNFTGNRYSLFY